MEEPTTSKDDFSRFQVFFYRKNGIQFEESKHYFVDKRLIERIEENGSRNFQHIHPET